VPQLDPLVQAEAVPARPGDGEHLHGQVDADHPLDLVAVAGQSEPRAHGQLEHGARRARRRPLAVVAQQPLLGDREDPVVVPRVRVVDGSHPFGRTPAHDRLLVDVHP